MTVKVNNANFEKEVIKSDMPVMVDFWAEWCNPCKMFSPVVDEVAGEYEGKMKVCKVNVDEASDVAGKYNIMSIPAVLIFKKGEVVGKLTGAVSKSVIKEKIEENI